MTDQATKSFQKSTKIKHNHSQNDEITSLSSVKKPVIHPAYLDYSRIRKEFRKTQA